jgi:hypothetical protein
MKTAAVLMLSSASALGTIVLVILHRRLRTVYGSILAWQFIFVGVAGMIVKDMIALYEVANATYAIESGWLITASVSFVRSLCYVIGFGMWAKQRVGLVGPAAGPHE